MIIKLLLINIKINSNNNNYSNNKINNVNYNNKNKKKEWITYKEWVKINRPLRSDKQQNNNSELFKLIYYHITTDL